MAGIFVAEGSGRVYLARVNLADEGACRTAVGKDAGCEIVDDRSRLVGISKDQVSDIALSVIQSRRGEPLRRRATSRASSATCN